MANRKVIGAYVLGIGAWVLAFFFALKLGAVNDPGIEVITSLRLPRIMLATAIGMGLAVSGAVLQALFSNPLCEPYTLGISSGSALGAVLGTSLGMEWNFAGLAGTAFLGAMIFAAILYIISLRTRSNNVTLLLSGVMLGFLGTSLMAVWIAVSDSSGLQGAIAWLFGDLSRARLRGAIFTLVSILVLALMLWSHWKDLDGLLMGEEGASALGVDVPRTRRRLILLSSLLVSLCVSAGGMIGFVGLVVPHFTRRWLGSLHLRLIPLCAVWGAVALTLADCLARVLVRPYELPVGVVTALIGAPLFLSVILKRRGRT